MTLNPIAPNMTELVLGTDTLVLFSYKTPVAARYTTPDGKIKFIRTNKLWSKTTSRHINKWLAIFGDVLVWTESQAFLDGLVK